MVTQTVLLWAAHNLFSATAVCFGAAMLIIMLYTYVHDYVLVTKRPLAFVLTPQSEITEDHSMSNQRTIITTGLSLFLAVAGWVVPLEAVQAGDPTPAKVVVPAPSAGVASGAVEDTLAICMGRIPPIATAGQRLMAEQSCHRDESGRSSMQAVPGR